MNQISELIHIMQQLRDPEQGCNWHNQQTMNSILPYTLEEIYELVGAVENRNMDNICEELGDLLFHVVYYAQFANEQQAFNFYDVIDKVTEKIRRRHPHVFSTEEPQSSELSWQQIKQQEKTTQANISEHSLLMGVEKALPALMRAYKLQVCAANVGFDWDNVEDVLAKVEEEIRELRQAHQSGDKLAIEEEIGDLLFACVNFARHVRIDAEAALRHGNDKFSRRFAYIEQTLKKNDKCIEDASLDEMEILWEEAKRQG